MAKKRGQLLYLIQAVHWDPEFDAAEWEPRTDHFHCPDPEGGGPGRTFMDRFSADAFCQAREAEARGPKNPYMRHPNLFCFGGKLAEQTSPPEGVPATG